MTGALKNAPGVFAVGNTYQIIVSVTCETLMWIKIGERCYYDHSNGILRSDVIVHKMSVPAEQLNKAKHYTVCYRRVIERKAYYGETSDVEQIDFDFYPVEGEKITAYHIADTHNMVKAPVEAARAFVRAYGKLDFLILNGDIPKDSDCLENLFTISELASQITGGHIPIVFSRGNHDIRGVCAEKLVEYTPCDNGKSYYSFRLGKLWGIVLDCGEDKADHRVECGNTICCHEFKLQETEYLDKIIDHAQTEYDSDEVLYKIVICHMPFTRKSEFDVEIYAYWAKRLREDIKPDLMLCGHMHEWSVDLPGGENDAYGQPCPIIVGSAVRLDESYCAGAGLIFSQDKAEIVFNDGTEVLGTSSIHFDR